ncbi:MAG: sporulation membrane protein YtaF [Syntrophomonadaceae bacterium]|nr:sporulation membrane protein YtaF [Syntrophomonadaceae bacterium]
MELLGILFFALAVSADGFLVGVAYGVKKIRIPLVSLAVIALASAVAVSVSMIFGRVLASILTSSTSSVIGAVLLIVIGVYYLFAACRETIEKIGNDGEPLLSLNIKSMGIIIQILKEPSSADFDSSGDISTREAFFLGLALAMDALGAGVGVAMAGYNILLTAISVGMLKFILVNGGILMGSRINGKCLQNIAALIPALIFLAIGVLEIM